jgi:hypothetical protein
MSLEAARSVDALDPQAAELALLGPAVAEGVLPAAHHLFVGRTHGAALVAVVALRALEHLLAVLLRGDGTLYTSHSCISFVSFSSVSRCSG